MTTQEPELETCWTGATWRSFPQPQIAQALTVRHLSDEVRAYLGGRPGRWCLVKEMRAVLDCSVDDLQNRLRGLVASGEVETQRIELWKAMRVCYRWVGPKVGA